MSGLRGIMSKVRKPRQKCPVCGDKNLVTEQLEGKTVVFCSWCNWRSDKKRV